MPDMASPFSHDSIPAESLDVVIVGAGFAGLYMLHRARQLGFSARVYEAGSGVGGTWFWNRYPGARCDVESLEYSYSFSEELQRDWQWTERYASQPEILSYLNHVCDRFHLRQDIRFEQKVKSAAFDETAQRWIIETAQGERVSAKFCVMATGCLSAAKVPDFKGLDTFRGNRYHTGQWPHHEINFRGQRVAVIGTGSSGVQSIPLIAEQASQLFVFQRTPNFTVPAHNRPLSEQTREDWKVNRPAYRERARTTYFGLLAEAGTKSALAASAAEREAEYQKRWQHGGLGLPGAFTDIFVNRQANETLAEFIRVKIRKVVRDPAMAEKLLPQGYPVGTKRLCVDTGFYETFNRENVTLVNLRATPIEEITPAGVRTSDRTYEVHTIVFATGYDAMTGAMGNIDIRGRRGDSLKQKWSAGPRTYLGLMVAGFPNLFTITGPGSPSVLSNMIVSIEQHVEWIADCLAYLRQKKLATIEPTIGAENAWFEHANAVANATLFPLADSWYVGANIPGKTRAFTPYIGGVGTYRKKCDEVAAAGYRGFTLGTEKP